MAKTLYEQLLALDSCLARYFKYLKEQNHHHRIDRRGAHEIFAGGLLDGGVITESEWKAIMLLIDHHQFTRDALVYLRQEFEKNSTEDAMIKGMGKRLRGADLDSFNRALGQGVIGSVDFESPGTNLLYSPCHYAVIREFVAQDDIKVFQMPIERKDLAADYSQTKNELVLYAEKDVVEMKGTVVHECTHAIQDWRDKNARVKHAEADAYIAEAVARRTMGKPYPKSIGADEIIMVAYNEAAPVVLKGKARTTHKVWREAYDKVVSAVEKDSTYKADKDKTYRFKEKSGPKEKSRMKDVITSLHHAAACALP